MHLPFTKNSQRLLLAAAALLSFVAATPAFATNPTATGALTVTATVNSSITLEFSSDASGVSLSSGTGTNTATLAFGSITEYGTAPAHTTVSTSPNFCSNCWSISTAVDIAVLQADGSSANYGLQAKLSTAAANGESLSVDGNATPLTTSYAAVGTTFNYTTANSHTIALGIANSTANATNLSDEVDFLATAN